MTRLSTFKQLPPVPVTDNSELTEFLSATKQLLDTYQGVVGNKYGLDRVVRFSDVSDLDPTKFASVRTTSFTSRITRVVGNIIRTGKIESSDSNTFFDLDNDKLVFNGKITFDSSMPGLFMGKDTDGIYKLSIKSGNYVSGAGGAGFSLTPDLLEVGNIACRGIFRTAVFQKSTLSAIGGGLLVLTSDVLSTDMTALDASTLTIEGNETFAVGDFLRQKNDSDDEWLEVTNAASAPTYTVTRDKAGDYAADTNPAWTKGTAVVNYGASGDGGVLLTSSETNAPHVSIFDHSGAPWTTINTRMRLGNLNGFLGYSSDLYGIAIGETDKYLKYDPTNGLRIKGTVTITGGSWSHASDATKIDGGDIYAGSVTATQITVANLAALNADIGTITAGNITLDSSGFLRTSGKDNYADTTAGIFLGYDTDAYKLNIGDASSYIKWNGSALSIQVASGEALEVYGDIEARDGSSFNLYDSGDNKVGTFFYSGDTIGLNSLLNKHIQIASGENLTIIADKYISLTASNSYILLNPSGTNPIWAYGDIRTNATTYDIGDATNYYAKIHSDCFYYRGTAGVTFDGAITNATIKGGVVTAAS